MNRNIFSQVQYKSPKKNVFDLTHDVKMSGKMGELYPVLALECVPGDKFDMGCESLIRFAPMLAPIMHRVDVTVHYFFVPNRIVWPGWESFITGDEENPEAAPVVTITAATTTPQQRFMDYFGIPPIAQFGTQLDTGVSPIPFAAYQKIYNEYYRDQNLIDPVPDKLVSGNNVLADFAVLRRRAWEHDYFTASLPFAQKGAQVDIPLGEITLNPDWYGGGSAEQPHFSDTNGGTTLVDEAVISGANLGAFNPYTYNEGDPSEPIAYDPKGSLQVQPTTINDLRRAFKLQEWLEKNARGGTRYTEAIKVHFDVSSPDKRLQRPEYITGVKSPVIVSEVLNQTGPTDYFDGTSVEQTGSPQGDMSGHGVAVMNGKSGSYFCEEHGYIIGVLSVLPRTAYQQGIPRHFRKFDYLDYFFPSFAHLGEQEVRTREIYAYNAAGNDVFGYVPRYAEYKYMPSRVAGDFRTTLNFWHLGRIFPTSPALNQDFIECDPADVFRIFAVQNDEDNLWMHLLHRIKAVRPMPYFGTPSI